MQVAYHLGTLCTDDDRLIRCLMRNSKTLNAEGIYAPHLGAYRPKLHETIGEHRGAPLPPEAQSELLTHIFSKDDEKSPQLERLILSLPNAFCIAANTLQDARLYKQAGDKAYWLSQLFPDAKCEFHLAIRNPATLLPALYGRLNNIPFQGFMNGTDPLTIRWSSVIEDIVSMIDGAPLTVWCNEDTPLIWPEVLREVSGHDPYTALKGTDDLLASIMSKEGMERLRSYLKEHPPANEIQRRRVVAAFLDKFALEEEVEMELDLPGWTETLVEDMTEAYEEDIFAIERMSGVQFLAP